MDVVHIDSDLIKSKYIIPEFVKRTEEYHKTSQLG